MKTLKEHKHETFEIITVYFRRKRARVELARCVDCGEVNKPLMELMQNRENVGFKLYKGNPFVWPKKVTWFEQKALVDAKDPRILTLEVKV